MLLVLVLVLLTSCCLAKKLIFSIRRGGLMRGRMFVNHVTRHYAKPLLGAGVSALFIFGIFIFLGLQ